jgi:sigma-B regulation protein RsbU (phosphoserine phosphatase)
MQATSDSLRFEHSFYAQPAELKAIRAAVQKRAVDAGCSDEEAADLVLAIDEACQNIIRHAYCGDAGMIDLRLEREGDAIVVTLRDYAPRSNPRCLERTRDLEMLRPGGLGTHFMKSVMDEVSLVELPDDEGNLLRMVKRLELGAD